MHRRQVGVGPAEGKEAERAAARQQRLVVSAARGRRTLRGAGALGDLLLGA